MCPFHGQEIEQGGKNHACGKAGKQQVDAPGGEPYGGHDDQRNQAERTDVEEQLVEAKMDELRVADAITEIFNIFRRCNKYIDETMPWTLAKDETKKERLATVLYNLTEAITIGASALTAFMPETSAKILAQLKTEKRSLSDMDRFGLYPSGNHVTDKPEILFARMDIEKVLEKVAAMQAAEDAVPGDGNC